MGLVVVLVGCRSTSDLVSVRARSVAKKAEQLVIQASSAEKLRLLDEAISLVGAELDKTPDNTRGRSLLHYTLAWLHYQKPGSASNAAGEYANAIRISPENRLARANMLDIYYDLREFAAAVKALRSVLDAGKATAEIRYAIRLDIAESLRRGNRPQLALEELKSLWRARPDNSAAASRIIGLTIENRQLHDELAELCAEFANEGKFSQSLDGRQILIASAADQDADVAVEDWVHTAAASGAFAETRVTALNALDPKKYALWHEFAEIRKAMKDSADDIASTPLKGWSQPKRGRVIARALQTMAASVALRGDEKGFRARARVIYERALAAASKAKDDKREPVGYRDRPDICLDIAIDLAIHLHGHRRTLDPKGIEFNSLLEQHLSLETFRGPDRTDEEEFRYWGLLGTVFSERAADLPPNSTKEAKERATADNRRAIQYLGEIVKYRHDANLEALPVLRENLAAALARDGRPVEALNEYLKTAYEYDSVGARSYSLRMFDAAKASTDTSIRDIRSRFQELEDVVHPRYLSPFYFGGTYGQSDGHAHAGIIESEMIRLGHSADVTFDDSSTAWKAFLGWEFHDHFALEAGYTSFDGFESTVIQTAPSIPGKAGDFLSDVGREHPVAGEGFTLAVLGYPYRNDSLGLDAFVKFGAWYWRADLDINTNVGPATRRYRDEFDAFFGVGLQWRATRSIAVRAEWESYLHNNDAVDLLSVGLVFRF